jgi:Tol biopolymer transport system component
MHRQTLLTVVVSVVAAVAAVPAGAGASTTADQITFARQIPTGGANVFITNPDGSNAHQVPLVYPAEDFGIPIWSPDRRHLLISHVVRFDTSGNLLPFRPATVDLNGSEFDLLSPPNAPFDTNCSGGWYPNSTRLLCDFGDVQAGSFSIRASDGGDPTRLTTYPYGSSCNACDEPTDISPDGRRFVFLRFKDEQTTHQQVALFVENLDGTGLRKITAYGVAAPHEIAAAQWSPDGRKIISETTAGRLFVVHPDGTGLTPIHLRIGTSRYFAFEPDWSPDGTRIVFCMWLGGQEDIYTANADGSNVVRITNTPAIENGPDWGRLPITPYVLRGPAVGTTSASIRLRGHFWYSKTTAGDVQSFYTVSANGQHERRLTSPGAVCCDLRVSPASGHRLLVMPGGDPGQPVTGGTISSAGTGFRRLHLTDPTLNLVPQAWSPDGTRIAFEGWQDGKPERTGVYTARFSDGARLVRVTVRHGRPHDVPLDYSPDGKWLVFYRAIRAEPNFPIDQGGSLWVVRTDGSKAHRLLTGAHRPADWARWSPDGTTLVFASERGSASGALWTIHPDGTHLHKLYQDPAGRFPIAPTWSPDGRHVLFALDPTNDAFTHPVNKLYVINAGGTGLTQIGHLDGFKAQFEWTR